MACLLAALLTFGAPQADFDSWTISVHYPRFSAKGPAARAANAAMATRERQLARDFLKRAKTEIPALKQMGSQNPMYELTVRPHRIADRPYLASGYVDRYDYLAGAHGTARYEVVNYGRVGGKMRPLRLRDLFLPGRDAVGECSRALLDALGSEAEPPGAVATGEWTRLTPVQAERFVVGKLGILFLFDQYDLGPGAQGSQLALAPFGKLRGLDRKGALAPLGL